MNPLSDRPSETAGYLFGIPIGTAITTILVEGLGWTVTLAGAVASLAVASIVALTTYLKARSMKNDG